MESATSSNEREMQVEENICDDDIEFVGEGHLRPVLECIELLSSDDDDLQDYNREPKDHVDHQKERVASTLERLARHVEVEKQQKAEKNRAFQEKLNFQHAHGLQELESIKNLPGASAAKFCVNQWLKMPGLKPGHVNSSRRSFTRPREPSTLNIQPITCPVMFCKRIFDNGQLLLGHLKRFDHSPCDPAITLHGACETLYACLVCLKRFLSIPEYNNHLSTKKKLDDGHHRNIPPLVVQCFACPSCFLLFYQRDDCLKHMSSSNHFIRTFILKDEKGVPCPIPIPSFAKNVLIALCKDFPFQVVCTSCRCELRSHVELSAHFRTRCRRAGPVALCEKSISDVASVFQLKAYCLSCKKAFTNDSHIEKHCEKPKHKVKRITSIEESILAFCYINERTKTPTDFCLLAANERLRPCMLKRIFHDDDSPSKLLQTCKKEERISGYVTKESSIAVKAWFCECRQKFSTERAAENHIMTANKISHKCLVCGKLAEDLGIIHLHMSRFHGGAHLNNFRFWCQICRFELSRIEAVMAHVSDCHDGHCFYYEKDVFEESPTSSQVQKRESEPPALPQQSTSSGMWQCHICEEMLDSEDSVQKHCKSLNIHQFHKYCCDTCNKKFHKIETLLRHCQLQHDGTIKMKYFCGLCEDLLFDSEKDFFAHYESFHSLDYGFVPNPTQSSSKSPEVSSTTFIESEKRLTCGCLANPFKNEEENANTRHCLDKLFETGKLWYRCSLCSATDQTYSGLSSHVCPTSKESSSKNFVVKCSICSESFTDADGAQDHYHKKHCFLEKPCINPHEISDSNNEVFQFTASGGCVSKKTMDTAHAKKSHFEAQGKSLSFSNISSSHTVTCKTEVEEMEIQHTLKDQDDSELPDLEFLRTMTHIVFVDLDNWAQFFTHLPRQLNQGTFVWGFQGGKNLWKPPVNCKTFKYLSNIGCFLLHPCCVDGKDAADFNISANAGRLDEQLPKQIPFSIFSGDEGFLELEGQFKNTQRPTHVLNPHHLGGDLMCSVLNNLSESTQETDDTDAEIDSVVLEEEANIEEAIRRSLVEM